MSEVLDRLRKHKENRGLMADLRCILVESKKHRAWPALHRLGVRIDDEVPGFIAGLYALHPEETNSGNFGTTCRTIEQRRGDRRGDDSRLSPLERRFQHLLSAEKNEVMDRVLRLVIMARNQGVPVNFDMLEKDLRFWTERTKTEWAREFWTPGGMQLPEEVP